MSRTVRTVRLNPEAVVRYLETYLSAYRPQSRAALLFHGGTARRFIDFLRRYESHGYVTLTGKCLERWLVEQTSGVAMSFAARRFQSLSRFLEALTQVGLCTGNPMRQFEAQFGKHRWVPIARALKSDDREAALNALRVVPPLSGPLGRHIREYLALKRSVGLKYQGVEYTLTSLDSFLHSRHVASVASANEQMVREWESNMTCTPAVRRARVQATNAFFNYLVGLGIVERNVCQLAVRSGSMRKASTFHPYIYSRQEIAALLAAAKSLPPNNRFRLRPHVCHCLIALLCALGLRLGEACRLHIGDVDLAQGLLLLRQTKFHKSRTVPFGPRVGRCLQAYLEARQRLFTPVRASDPLFVAYRPTCVCTSMIRGPFPALLKSAGIDSLGPPRPRLHDLRHTFAVHRLLRWYREGVDVQSKLPLLSTFLGHVEISSTQVYLTITADLLREANRRFQRDFGDVFAKGGRS